MKVYFITINALSSLANNMKLWLTYKNCLC